MSDDFDHHMMGIALTLARRGLGRTAPNPSVGAIIVDPVERMVVSRAVTAPGGRPHAEPLAIAAANGRTRGATLYVTLEPCSHHGQTAPCADAIIGSGIARVVCGIEDPDPRVGGRGLASLRAAGIAVQRGVRTTEARDLTRGHVYRVTQRRPFVQLKLALRGDGSVPHAVGGHPVFVTCPEARALGHLMRAQADAILVGSGTFKADDSELTCRLPGMLGRSPLRVVLARSGIQLAGTKLGATIKLAPIAIFVAAGTAGHAPDVPTPAGVTVHGVPIVDGQIWLPSVLERLAEIGVTRLLVEGGPAIWRSFARAGLADEIVVFRAGTPHGSHDVHHDIERHLGDTAYTLVTSRRIGTDEVWYLRPASSSPETLPKRLEQA